MHHIIERVHELKSMPKGQYSSTCLGIAQFLEGLKSTEGHKGGLDALKICSSNGNKMKKSECENVLKKLAYECNTLKKYQEGESKRSKENSSLNKLVQP